MNQFAGLGGVQIDVRGRARIPPADGVARTMGYSGSGRQLRRPITRGGPYPSDISWD
jgi:hypothetical protein